MKEMKREQMSQDELKKMRRASYIKMVAIVGFMVAVMAFSSIAWFTMNREVEGEGVQMTSSGLPFDLAVPERSSAENFYNAKIETLGYLTGNDNLITNGDAIRWVMKDESTDTTSSDYVGICPGSYGSLTFYILPKSEGDCSCSFDLSMTGYYAEFVSDSSKELKTEGEGENVADIFHTLEYMAEQMTSQAEEAENADAARSYRDAAEAYRNASDYIQGHIMFFQDRKQLTAEELGETVDASYYYSGLIVDSFSYNTAEHHSEKTTIYGRDAYPVKIYWIWPNTFGQIILDNGNENLYNDAMFSQKQTVSPNPRNTLISYIAEHPSIYFNSSALKGQNSVSLTNMMGETSLNSTNALIELSNGYNSADQVIGDHVNFILIEMTASANINS